jgi:hypothetical protein
LNIHDDCAALFVYADDVDNIGGKFGLLKDHERRQVGGIDSRGLNQAAVQLITL